MIQIDLKKNKQNKEELYDLGILADAVEWGKKHAQGEIESPSSHQVLASMKLFICSELGILFKESEFEDMTDYDLGLQFGYLREKKLIENGAPKQATIAQKTINQAENTIANDPFLKEEFADEESFLDQAIDGGYKNG